MAAAILNRRPALYILAASCAAQGLPPHDHAALESITPAALQAHVAFLASDLLEGRNSPSRGLDIAAEYIASQFRRSGLEPLHDGGYLQPMNFVLRGAAESFDAVLASPEGELRLSGENAVLRRAPGFEIDAPVGGAEVLIRKIRSRQEMSDLAASFRKAPPRLAILLDESKQIAARYRRPAITDPAHSGPAILVLENSDQLEAALRSNRVLIRGARAEDRPARIANVAGLLRGADPKLAATAVIVSAHYDHIGASGKGEDRIYNGANDDASGTAAITEIASALGRMPKPARSVIFIAFAAEEHGGAGSQHWIRNPLWPLEHTVANVNLEQVGRSDGDLGAKRISATGFDYSCVTASFAAAAESLGVRLEKHAHSDRYFSQSDNIRFAEAGIPAHTFCTSFEFAEYHQPGDEWQKLDYANMALVTRVIALGVRSLASDAAPPRWDSTVDRARRFSEVRAGASAIRTPAQ